MKPHKLRLLISVVTIWMALLNAANAQADPKICTGQMGFGFQVCMLTTMATQQGYQATGDWFWKRSKAELDDAFRNTAFTLPHDYATADTSSDAPLLSMNCSNNGLRVGFVIMDGSATRVSEVTYKIGDGSIQKKPLKLDSSGLVAFSSRDALDFVNSLRKSERMVAKLNDDKHGEMKFGMRETGKVLVNTIAPCVK